MCVAVIIERPGLVRGAVAGASGAVRSNRSIRNSNGIVQEFLEFSRSTHMSASLYMSLCLFSHFAKGVVVVEEQPLE